jgi:hypothetical protein
MKTTSPQRRLALASILGAVSFLGACSSGVKLDDLSTVKAGGSDSSNFASQPWNDPKSPLFQRRSILTLMSLRSNLSIKICYKRAPHSLNKIRNKRS